MTAPAITPAELAAAQQARQALLARRVVDVAEAAWLQIDPDAIADSWAELAPAVERTLAAGQYFAAAQAADYLDAATDGPVAGEVVPAGFAGQAADGRPLTSLLTLPVGSVLGDLRAGLGVGEALTRGRAQLLLGVQTEVADAGRLATGAGITARPQLRGHVRIVNPPACDRCILLAGRVYRWSQGFQRHPRCDCTMAPFGSGAADVQQSPQELFGTMSPAEQDAAFTKAGAQAIRDGADLGQVVNARRGMYEAGGRSFTTEGTTRRGLAGKQLEAAGAGVRKVAGERVRRVNVPRLTPQQIYREAGADRAEAVRLLKRHGYLT